MSDPYIGQIKMCGFDFAPRGYAQCNGQMLSIAQNTALFSLLGTTYGGNGQTTFALPDLRGRTPISFASSADSGWTPTPVQLGQVAGVENVTLLQNNVPSHNHTAMASTTAGNNRIPSNRVYATSTNPIAPLPLYASSSGPLVSMSPQTINASGGNQPHSNMQPYLTINFCIALQGLFPSRN